MAFGLTIFVSAFLLFQVQPMLGKAVVPWFGGGAAVWTVCLLFFQCQLLAGYAYAHVIAKRLPRVRQRRLHVALIAVAIGVMIVRVALGGSPILPSAAWQPDDPDHPIRRLLALLGACVGLPYLVLASTGPLVQSWFAAARPTMSPYRLYALSNAGSLLALVTYPFVIEPHVTLHVQAIVWAGGFAVFAIGTIACARAPAVATTTMVADDDAAPPTRAARALWIALPACASLLLLATTNELSQIIAPIPFLWVMPLAIYLLSWIVAFAGDRVYRPAVFGVALVVAIALATDTLGHRIVPAHRGLAVFGFALFVIATTCHGEVARLRPPTRYLTAYYLSTAAGGALGGVLVGVIAPLVFDGYWEIFVGVWVAAALVVAIAALDPRAWVRRRRPWPALAVLVVALAMVARVRDWTDVLAWPAPFPWLAAVGALGIVWAARALWPTARPRLALAWLVGALACLAGALAQQRVTVKSDRELHRGFYGLLAIRYLDVGLPTAQILLAHDHTLHGAQFLAPAWRDAPTTYYVQASGVGRAILDHPDRGRGMRIGVVGLGVGTMASYGRAGDTLRFYELDPDVIALSTGVSPMFTYLADCACTIELAPGDARLSLERELAVRPQQFDVLVIDAFAGDTIPIHLLTREAVATDIAHLGPDGILAIHISNRYLDLEKVVAGHVRALGLAAAEVLLTENDDRWGSDWILVARDASVLHRAKLDVDSYPPVGDVEWTDDASDLLGVLR